MLSHTIAQIFHDIDNELYNRYSYEHEPPQNMYQKLIAFGGTIRPYKNGTDYDVRFGKYEITINPQMFKVCEIINEQPNNIELTPFGLAKIFNAAAMRERWIFEINNVNTIHYYASSVYSYTSHPYCTTEESYFQESTLHDFGTMTLEDMQHIEEFRLAVLQCVEHYKRGTLWNN